VHFTRNLSLNLYQEIEHDAVELADSWYIIRERRAIESEIAQGLTQLETTLGESKTYYPGVRCAKSILKQTVSDESKITLKSP
jgi:hypothetical protein